MTSIYALSVLLFFCLYAQTPAQGGLTKLVNCKRIDHGDRFEFIAEYEADSNFDVFWRRDGMEQEIQSAGPGSGVTTMELRKTTGAKYRPWVALSLGELPGHYITVEWNVDGDGDRSFSTPLEFDMSTITPGTDLAYIPGSTSKIQVEVNENKGGGHLSFIDFEVYALYKYLDPATNNVVTQEQPPFLMHNTTRADDVSTTILTLHSNDVIDGYLTSFVEGQAKNLNTSPVKEVYEEFVFSIHEENKEVSFPFGNIR